LELPMRLRESNLARFLLLVGFGALLAGTGALMICWGMNMVPSWDPDYFHTKLRAMFNPSDGLWLTAPCLVVIVLAIVALYIGLRSLLRNPK
jgi:hypothetical protein